MAKNKIKTLKDVLSIVKLSPLLETYTDIKTNGGIKMRINGKGTNPSSKLNDNKDLKPEEKDGIKKAFKEFSDDGNEFFKTW